MGAGGFTHGLTSHACVACLKWRRWDYVALQNSPRDVFLELRPSVSPSPTYLAGKIERKWAADRTSTGSRTGRNQIRTSLKFQFESGIWIEQTNGMQNGIQTHLNRINSNGFKYDFFQTFSAFGVNYWGVILHNINISKNIRYKSPCTLYINNYTKVL